MSETQQIVADYKEEYQRITRTMPDILIGNGWVRVNQNPLRPWQVKALTATLKTQRNPHPHVLSEAIAAGPAFAS